MFTSVHIRAADSVLHLCCAFVFIYAMATKRKNVVVTMEKRLEALGRIDKGESLKTIAASYGVGTSTVFRQKHRRLNCSC